MRELPRSLLVKLYLRVLETMREVILQNMMGRSVLPIPLICRQKKHTQGRVRRKIKPLLFDFVVVVLIVLEVFGYQMKQLSEFLYMLSNDFLLKEF